MTIIIICILLGLASVYLIIIFLMKHNAVRQGQIAAVNNATGPNGEEIAAIALALQLWESDTQATQSAAVAMNSPVRAYSQWNLKMYTLTQLPNRNRR